MNLDDLLMRENVIDISEFRQEDAEEGGRWRRSAIAVCDAAAEGPVVLAIPGHPRFGEGLVIDTLHIAAERELSTKVIDGISVIDLLATALGVDPLAEDVQLFHGRALTARMDDGPFSGGRFTGSPLRPMLFTHVYDSAIIEGIRRALERILPPDHPVVRIDVAGAPDQRIDRHTVSELRNVPGGPMVALYVPKLGELDAARDPRTLQHIVARLRRPDGCPWDRKQNHETLRDSIIDEAYEVLDAIDAGDDVNLAEELGDLLLLVMMHAQIAEEAGTFTLEDVYEGISRKIVRRHPHVFGDMSAEDAGEVVGLWNQIKAEEKADQPQKPEKAADGQPHSMPALERAPRVLRKHPIRQNLPQSTAEERSQALLAAVADIAAAGDDPDQVLRQALIDHVQTDNS
jgi:tetrapyrrole methylase family protein/MazG family protein